MEYARKPTSFSLLQRPMKKKIRLLLELEQYSTEKG